MSESTNLITLPADIHVHILHALPDLSTLQSTIRAHPCLYSTFSTYRTQILKSVFLNQVFAPERVDFRVVRRFVPKHSRRHVINVLDNKAVDILIPAIEKDTTGSGSGKSKNARRKTYSTESICERAEAIIPGPINSAWGEMRIWEDPNDQSIQFPLPKLYYLHPDSMIFLEAWWSAIPRKIIDSGSGRILRCARDLTCSYFYNDKLPEALKLATYIWDSISEYFVPPQSYSGRSRPIITSHSSFEHECVHLLIAIYRTLQMNQEAIDLQKDVISRLNPKSEYHSSYSIGLAQTYKSLGPTYLPTLITFQTETWKLYSSVHHGSHPTARNWARQVLLTYNSAGIVQESLDFQSRVLDVLTPGTMEYISWSRGLINACRKSPSLAPSANPDEVILAITARTFSSYHVQTPGYIGWSRDLCKLFRLQNREEDALRIELVVWETMKRMVTARPSGKAEKFKAKAPGLVLAASYRRLGRLEDAVAVEEEIRTKLGYEI